MPGTPENVRTGKYKDDESSHVKKVGPATTFGTLGLDADEMHNGEAPRDRGNRSA